MSLKEHDLEGGMESVDDRTILYGEGSDLWALLDDLDRISIGRPKWIDRSRMLDDRDVMLICNTAMMRTFLPQPFESQPEDIRETLDTLWKNTDLLIGGMSLGDRFTLNASLWEKNADSAVEVHQALQGLIPVGQSMLQGGRDRLEESRRKNSGTPSACDVTN